MAAYLIAEVTEVMDPTGFDEYRSKVGPVIAKYGGVYRAAGGACDRVEGDWNPGVVVLIEFPSMARAKEWYAADDYRELKELRMRSAKTNLIFTEGL